MKKILVSLLAILIIQAQALALTIPAGTLVVVQPNKTIDADDVKTGDNVKFVVSKQVKVNGKVVIKMGTEIDAKVVNRKNNGILGIPGEIEIGEFKLITADNDILLLNGGISDKGDGRYWANVGWFFMFPLLFIKGDDGKIKKHSTHMLYTAEDFNL